MLFIEVAVAGRQGGEVHLELAVDGVRRDDAGYFFYVMELADPEEMQNEECKMKNEAAANPTASACQRPCCPSEC